MAGPGGSDTHYWREVEDVFASVLDAEPARREAILKDQCGDRVELRTEVEALLASHDRAGEFIRPRTVSGPDFEAPSEQGALIGTRVGAFRLLEQIGEGGMGAVYRAERVEGDFAQQAAVKLIASRLHSADTLRRFRSERQILASLQHSNIVALVDGGLTPQGQPYLAMEYVEGLPVTEYCATNKTSLHERIRLFLQVCGAVRFAHQHLVVHRDLKPANVLVNREGVVKVLDFGIAKLLQEDGAPVEATGLALGPLTTDYASPEQLRGGVVSTASDVYSLGVLLYELLAGHKAYRTAGKTLDDVLRVVVQDEPPRPSASPRGDLSYEPSRLRGDLDAIIVKAMAKDPERRYASAEDLSADLERHLAGRPVKAQPESRSYVIGKFLRRHRVAATAALIAVLAVLTGLGASLWQARLARAERDRATAQLRKAQETTRFLSGIFENANPVSAGGKTVTARDLLDAGALSIARELSDQPETRADLLIVMARAYHRLGLLPRAEELAAEALALRSGTAGVEDPAIAEAEHLVGRMRRAQGRSADAIEILRTALKRYENSIGPSTSEVARVARDLAIASRDTGKPSEAKALIQRAIAIEEKAAPASAHHALLWNTLGNLLVSEGDLLGARAAFDRSIRVYEGVSGPESWGIALPMLSLGDALRSREDWAQAKVLFERALEVDIKTFGEVSDSTAYTLGRLGDLALGEGRVREARPLIERSLRMLESSDARSVGAMLTRAFMGQLLVAEGRPREALPLLDQVLKQRESMHGPNHPEVALALVDLGSAHRLLGDFIRAQAMLTRALEVQRGTLRRGHPALVRTLAELAETNARSNPEKARTLLVEAVEIATAELPEKHSHRVRAEAALVRSGPR